MTWPFDNWTKPLVPVVGVPNIELLIVHLKHAGITDLVINAHHLAAELQAALGDGQRLGVDITYSIELPEILGTGGGIKRALPVLGDEPFLVINGDVLFTPDIDRAIEVHERSDALATLVVRTDPEAERYGTVGLDDGDRVRRLVGAGDPAEGHRAHMFTGVHVIDPALAALLPDQGCIVRQTYMPMVERHEPIAAVIDERYFCDLGTPERYLAANVDLVTGAAQANGIAPPKDGVFVDVSATVGDGCRIGPGTVIGAGVTVAGGVALERVVALPGAVIETDAKGAILAPGGVILQL